MSADALSRPLSGFQKWFASSFQSLQSSVELKNPRVATEFVDFAIKSLPALHLRCQKGVLYPEPSPVEVAKIPPRVKTVFDCSQWSEVANLPDWSERLGSIAIRDSLVTFSCSHCCYDGVSLIVLADRFRKGQLVIPAKLPLAVDHHVAPELAKPYNTQEHVKSMNTLTLAPWSSPLVRKWPDDIRSTAIAAPSKPDTLKCYNPKTKMFQKLTDVMWRTGILAALALDPNQTDYACSTWVNMRPEIPDQGIGCFVAPLTIRAEGVSMEMTVAEFDAKLRRDFNDKMKSRGHFLALKATLTGMPVPPKKAAFFDVSNVGYMKADDLIVDYWVQQTMTAKRCVSAIGLGVATVFGNQNARFLLRYPFSPFVFSRSDAIRGYKAVMHSLQQLDTRLKLKDAIRELREVAV
jgi:hypothetical protein